jgi:pyruvate formate lyase activating enzyme
MQAEPAESKNGSGPATPVASQVAGESLADALDRYTAAGSLFRVEDGRIRCVACGHRCLIAPGRRGICRVRYNQDGQLRVPFGYVAGVQSDPVEKKPFFHVYPGTDALTFGMLGCDFHCGYCQNWVTSQALRDPTPRTSFQAATPSQLVNTGRRLGSRLVVSSYNEPLITAEWAVAVFQEAKAAGLACAFVSNGNATPEALDLLRPWIVAYKIDFKSYDDRRYRSLGGTLEHVKEGVRMVHERGLWLEVVTLVVPGFNDSEPELRCIAQFLASVSRDIPWHVTAFHPDYKMTEPPHTAPDQLIRAAEIGAEEGLRYVYVGNVPGHAGEWEDTRCPNCQATLIARFGFMVRSYRLTEQGTCPECGTSIPGIWPGNGAGEVRTGSGMTDYYKRWPRRVDLV